MSLLYMIQPIALAEGPFLIVHMHLVLISITQLNITNMEFYVHV